MITLPTGRQGIVGPMEDGEMRARRGMMGGSQRSVGERARGRRPALEAGSPIALRMGRLRAALRSPAGAALGIAAAVAVWLAVIALAGTFGLRPFAPDQDARAYWVATVADPYRLATVGVPGAYLYSPAFLQFLAPLRALSWPGFVAVWTLVLLAAVAYLAGPELLAPAIALAFVEIWGGNITLLLAVAIVLGFRWPATWSFVILTKVTPGVGLLWFVVRREWGRLGVALLATGVVVGLSALAGSGQWTQWLQVLAGNVGADGTWAAIPIPLLPRLPLAAAVIVWAARGDRRWALPIGCLLALPVIWYGSLTLLLAVPPLLRRDRGDWREALAVADRLAGGKRVVASAFDGLARAQRKQAGDAADRAQGAAEAEAG